MKRDKIAVVFGGRSPIALECALQISLMQRVLLVSRSDDDEIRRLINGSNVEVIAANLEVEGESTRVMLHAKRLGCELNAAIFLQRYKDSKPNFQLHASVELWSIVEALEVIEAQNTHSGFVQVLISSSPAANQVLFDQDVSYHIVKAGQESIVRYYATKLAKTNIFINAIRIGSLVQKPRAAAYWRSVPEVVAGLSKISSSERVLTSNEVGTHLAKLATGLSPGITGQVITIDNGFSLRDSAQVARLALEGKL